MKVEVVRTTRYGDDVEDVNLELSYLEGLAMLEAISSGLLHAGRKKTAGEHPVRGLGSFWDDSGSAEYQVSVATPV